MNHLFLLLLFPFLATHFGFAPNAASFEEEIVWSGDRRLSWEDFKGIPSGRQITGAVTYSTIKATPSVAGYFNNRIEVDVKAIFRCDRSWAKDKAKESDYLLNHEQRHFDIAEVYARKIRTALQDHHITPRNYPRIKAQVIEPLFREYVNFDKSYDKTTVHGLSSDLQEEWDHKIDEALGLIESEYADN
ncbi:DUF922 domain-containing protein [Flavilitoribacter nigricans]|uniref:DUF922 domain-containing protein n=1 Tax=Flavilitoribacter nigricans (strain ATCC 23147 / DSM 23189 / NBRC 102662 / NCIMB 1420 / SS-2) TaxID=1122177 RepID=A0A2D0ND40_FLAN2|nr:hypothetical protein [Flavilitoribacter nigricans]PHN06290.1 hypothetical protein CRP01_12005 [Flavilitoribacter nigricans DSM 23189 = NBRC 102662]